MQILKIRTEKRITGNIGEDAACKYLRKNKYKILKRNYVSDGHEIDIIAENREFICFVEVKTRTLGHEDERESRPAASVNKEKQLAIISAARSFIAIQNERKPLRFDIAEVFLNDKKAVENISYLEGAFTLDTAKKSGFR